MKKRSCLTLIALIGICVFALPYLMFFYAGFGISPVNRIEETHTCFKWSPGWERQENANASGETWMVSSIQDSTVIVSFTGTGIVLYYTKGPDGGIATIELDGESYTFIDMYSPIRENKVNRTIARGLEKTSHILKITVSRIKNLKSSNSFVIVDAIEIIQP